MLHRTSSPVIFVATRFLPRFIRFKKDMSRRMLFLVAASVTLVPSLASARKPFFRRSATKPAASQRATALPSRARSLAASILQDDAEMTRRFGPSILVSDAPSSNDNVVRQPSVQ